jgi:hypothetical protein
VSDCFAVIYVSVRAAYFVAPKQLVPAMPHIHLPARDGVPAMPWHGYAAVTAAPVVMTVLSQTAADGLFVRCAG